MSLEKRIQLLDATIRDGGQGLEAGYSSHFYTSKFQKQDIQEIIRLLVDSRADFVELGCMAPSNEDITCFAHYQGIEELSETMPSHLNEGQNCIGLYIGPDTDEEDIPAWNPSLCKYVRVILRYSQLDKSLEYCAMLSQKGYKVFVQPMLTMRYTDEELDNVIAASNDMHAYATYFVDSYGYMMPGDIKRLFHYYDERLDRNIRIGFHAHNNMDMAFANVQAFLTIPSDRKVIVDSCVTGMGQGAGNMQTELLVPYLNTYWGGHYNYDAVLDACEYLEKRFLKDNEWGYDVTRLLPAIHKCAYKYSVTFRKLYHLSYKDINRILSQMSYEYKQRYTSERACKLVEWLKECK